MRFPPLHDSGIAFILYAFLLFVIAFGLWQFIRSRKRVDGGAETKVRSLVPLGGAAAAFGLIGLYWKWADAFEAIEVAADISPAIVAEALRHGLDYPVMGFFILAVTFVFRFVNQ